MSQENDVFFIKTTDGTEFGIYNLQMSEECDKISFGYESVEPLEISKEEYGSEISNIVKLLVSDAFSEGLFY